MIHRLLLTAAALSAALLLSTSPPAAAQDGTSKAVVAGCWVTCAGHHFACCDCKANKCTCPELEESDTNCTSGGHGATGCGCGGSSAAAAVNAALDMFLGTLQESPIALNEEQQAAWQSLLSVLQSFQP